MRANTTVARHPGHILMALIPLMGILGCGEEPVRLERVLPGQVRAGEIVTVAGAQFGVDVARGSVQVGTSTVEVIQWTSSVIKIKIPEGTKAGATVVTVTVGDSTSNSMELTIVPPDPVVSTIEPDEVWPGDSFVLKGQDLGSQPGTLMFGGKTIPAQAWSQTRIEGVVPESTEGGVVSVKTADGRDAPSQLFKLLKPRLFAVTPEQVRKGDLITLKGKDFGESGDGSVLIGDAQAQVEGWEPTKVTAIVPELPKDVGRAQVTLVTHGVQSRPKNIDLPAYPADGTIVDIVEGAGPYNEILSTPDVWPLLSYFHDFEASAKAIGWNGFSWDLLPSMDHPTLHEGLPDPNMRKIVGWGLRSVSDGQGEIYSAMINTHDYSVYYAHFSGGAWTMEPAIPKPRRQTFQSLSIALNSSKEPVIALFREEDGITIHRRTATGWESESVDPTGGEGGWAAWVDLAIDSRGTCHMAYFDGGKGQLKYVAGTPGAWSTAIVDSSGIAGAYASIALSDKGNVAIAYGALEDQSTRLARLSNGEWKTTTLDSGPKAGRETDIAVDSEGRIHVVYFCDDEKLGGGVKYVTNQSGSFQTEILAKGLGVTGRPSIHIPDGQIAFISYTNATLRQMALQIRPKPKFVRQPAAGAAPQKFQWVKETIVEGSEVEVEMPAKDGASAGDGR